MDETSLSGSTQMHGLRYMIFGYALVYISSLITHINAHNPLKHISGNFQEIK